MSGSHEKLPWLFWAQLALVMIVGILYLLAPAKEKYGTEASESSKMVKEAESTLKPVGTIATASEEKSGAVAESGKSGQQVYNEACAACHTSGIANAPKPDDKGAWQERVAQGLDGLINTAINGKGAMPPRGGNPAVTDADIKSAILYMTEKAGFNLASAGGSVETGETTSGATEQTVSQQTEEPPASVETNTGSALPAGSSGSTNAPEEPQAAEAPKEPVPLRAPAAPVAPVPPTPAMAKAPPAAPPMAINNNQTPPAAPTAVPSEVNAISEPVAPQIGNAELAEAPQETMPVTEVPVAEVPVASKETASISLEEGKIIYNSTCFSCHAAGVAGAPKLEDKAIWEARLAAGNDVLYNSAINGKGIMPPKGGNMSLSDDVVKAAVDYMISQVK